ncbi:MAG: ABC transporter substrate-binding protein [Anaerotignum sp.]|nr:ABC transporter substrate-binding protein [Anaerotignum sp.]
MKKFIALALASVMTFSLAACGGGGSDEAAVAGTPISGDTIKIGVFEPTTGENGGGGMQEVLGIRYANTVAPTVDINGTTYNIELVEVDNQSDKTAAVTAAQSLISSGVVGVLGSYGSGVSIAAGQTYAEAGVPAIGCSCTNPQVTLGNDFYFRTCFLDPFQGTVMASYAAEEMGYKTAAIISQNGDDYSTGIAAYFKQAFESLGGTIVADETYQTNESDFNAILTTVKASNAECVFIPCSIATATLILPQAQAVGLDAHILGSDTWENESIVMAAGSAAEGVVFSTFFDENDESTPMAKDFVNGFKAYLNEDPQRVTLNGGTDGVAAVSALGYDAYMTMVAALASLDGVEGDLTSVNLRDALAAVNHDGVTGNITFDETGDANKDSAYLKKVEGGKFVFVKKQLDETK